MITPAGSFRIFLATQPVDFRKGMDGLAGHVTACFDLDPFSGAIYVFRSRRADRLKLIVWDGTGMVLITKRLQDRGFVWPKAQDGAYAMSKTQFEALFEGIDWRRVGTAQTSRPMVL